MSISKTALWFAGLAGLVTSAATAADAPRYARPGSSYHERLAYRWDGAYFGAHSGFASTRLNPFADGRGIAGGLQAGYNFQFGSGVFGAEVEGSYLGGAEQSVRGGTLEEKWRLAAKAKAGLSADSTLLYGTAGFAMTKLEEGAGVSNGGGWHNGFLLGGGVEQAFGGALSLKIEYNYLFTTDVKTTTSAGTFENDLSGHVIKAGLNYRF